MKLQGIVRERAIREPFDMFKMMAMGMDDAPPRPGEPGFADTAHKEGNGPGDPKGAPPPGMIFGSDPQAGAALVIDESGVNQSESRSSWITAGSYDAKQAEGLCISADDGHTGGVYVTGKDVSYTVSNAKIQLSGDSVGLGGSMSGLAADHGAKLTVRDSEIETWGKARSATSCTDNSTLYVYDSRMLCHGGPFEENNIGMSGLPRDIQGNARCHITMGNSSSYFYRSAVIADGWASLSTDIAQGMVYVEANDCHLETTKSGYICYADGGCKVKISGGTAKSARMAGVIAGEAELVYENARIDCAAFGTKFHCIGQKDEAGTLTIDGCEIHTKEEQLLILSDNADITVRNSVMVSDSGVILQSRKNPDPHAAKVDGAAVYGIHAAFTGCRLQGSFLHEDPERTANVYLTDSTVTGEMQNVVLWLLEGGSWYADRDSSITLVGTPDSSQINAPEGVTITAVCGQSGMAKLADGGTLVMVCA